ncbi:Type I phosphodiesterase / nucleotide pyrophosphatase [Lacunisphaera limnophila]|uniref:Type I phosphodiesterase / nucleotide pyrophosphatase n=1 Tax=Lacunisphaera limnophila TaxID=1838286 RepID=A0A1D8ASM6_9BACT|nr:ectonucleotide pyrophosphatase/phosphodiesterase [Lacunisphaera limnophila]AOS43866.1 Type I phosphodiesterase / nucleotide pyrophosphatase [Lacunisphaera limnophila]
MRRVPLLLLLLASLGLISCTTPGTGPAAGPLILVSIDGFRWDYLEKYDAPVLRRLAAAGVHARRMTPSFPSKTFPNHYTIVTGLRPQRHGIVANSFYDPALNDTFGMPRKEEVWWSGGEPLWITAEKQDVRTAIYFWPGSESSLQGRRPTQFQPFQKNRLTTERVDGALAWLDRPAAERPRFLALYLEHLDIAGHAHGPDAPETAAAVKEADDAIARLLAGLEKLGLRDSANLVIVSDHGMSAASPDRVVFFEDLMDLSLVSVEAAGPYGGVRPKAGVDPAALVASIRAHAPPQVQVYRREDMPARLHYNHGDRVPPILLLMDDGWSIEQKPGWPALRARYSKGNHGWDPALPSMGALFIATGPAFRRGTQLADVDNVDVYDLLCAVLGITPAPNDGTTKLTRAALRP